MKKTATALLLILAMFCLVGVVLAVTTKAVTTTNGRGGWISTSTDTNVVDVRFDTIVRVFSVYNAGASTQIVWVLPNCTVAEMNTAVNNTNAVPVRGGNAETFVGGIKSTNICLRGADGHGSMTVDVAAER